MSTSGEAAPPYRGPQFAAPGVVPQPPGVGLSDDQLRRLPPPPAPLAVPVPPGQRPVAVGLGCTLAVTASLLWVCALSLGWVLAVAGTDVLARGGSDGFAFHLLDRFRDRMLDGLWLPLYGFPLVSLVSGFLLLRRRSWTRTLHTAVGTLALAWSAWWLRDTLLAWGTVAVYVGVALAVLRTPAASRWYASATRGSGRSAPS